MKYKIGDTIKRISNPCDDGALNVGDTGKIFRINEGSETYRVINNRNGKEQTWFEGYTELVNHTQTITIRQKGRKVIAVLTDADGKFIKSAKARYNPNDELEGKPFDFEIGKKIAVKRLLGEDKLNLKLSIDGKPLAETVKKLGEAMKGLALTAKGFKVGDKVRIKKDRKDISTYSITEKRIKPLEGKELMISYVNYSASQPYIRLKEDELGFGWNPEMFELATEPTLFDWQSFKSGKIAVHCDTEEKAKAFLKECDEQGISWKCIGKKATEFSVGATCYCCSDCFAGLMHSPKSYYESEGKKIIDYTPSKPTVKEVKRPAKVGEWIKVTKDDGYSDNDYKVGDVLRVVKNSDPSRSDGAYYKDEYCKYVSHEDYVVLENYQPEDKSIDSNPELEQPISSASMREVKREAKAGEYVKVKCDSEALGYNEGDILRIIEPEHRDATYWYRFKNGKNLYGTNYVLLNHEYVVLENYDYSLGFPKNEPFRKAKVGDKIKVVADKTYHVPKIKNGDVQIVTEVRINGVCTAKGNMFCDTDQEYIIIEEAPEVKAETINIGDAVKVFDSGRCFDSYTQWFEENEPKIGLRYAYRQIPPTDIEYEVVAKHLHGHGYANYMCYAIQEDSSSPVYLVGEKAIKKVQ